MKREPFGFLFLALVCLTAVLSDGRILRSINQCGLNCGLEVSGDPLAIAAFVSVGIWLVVCPRRPASIDHSRPVRIWRRACAALIDLLALSFLLVPIAVIADLSLYWWIEGNWVWAFRVPNEHVIANLELLRFAPVVVLTLLWFSLQSRFGRATPGQYLMGYQIFPDPEFEGYESYGFSTFVGWFAIWTFHVWAWFVSQESTRDGRCWWEKTAHTRAFMTSA